ncbi:hypothetical protein BOX15_Mlig016692g2, partial [Macrostomum lignano]
WSESEQSIINLPSSHRRDSGNKSNTAKQQSRERTMSGRGGEKIRYAKQEIPSNYSHVLQSARNRAAAAAAAADASGSKRRQQADREQGFRLYFSGANHGNQQLQQQKTARLAAGAADSAAAYTSRKAKTSIGNRAQQQQQQQRSRTAAPPRKGWAPGDQDITIRTQTGDLVNVPAPYKYEQDFDDADLNDDDQTESLLLSARDVHALRQSILQLGGGGNGDSNEDDASQIDEEELPPPSGSTDDNDGSDVLDRELDSVRSVVGDEVGGGGASSDARVVLQLRKSLGPAYDEGHKLDYIIQRIMELSVGQRDKLMQAFAHIDQQQQQPAKSAANLANEAIAEANQPPKQQPAAQAAVGHVIRLRLHSNWGHPGLIGLTELQCFDSDARQIRIDRICLDENKRPSVVLECLINGRYLTNKERNMWTCPLLPGQPVDIYLHMAKRPASLKVWNYNRSLQTLDIGARRVEISIDNGPALFNGELDKGCGSQGIDFGQKISLSAKQAGVRIDEDDELQSAAELNRRHNKKYAKTPRLAAASPRCATRGLDDPGLLGDDAEDQDASCLMDKVRLMRRSRQEQKAAAAAAAASTASIDSPRESPRPSATSAAPVNAAEELSLTMAAQPPTSSSKAPAAAPPAPKFGRRSRLTDNKDDDGNDAYAGARADLEKSWASLNQFNKLTAGRLDTRPEGDALDSLLQRAARLTSPAQPPQQPQPPAPVEQPPPPSTAVGSDDIETNGFVIPELPAGQLLHLNILDTWGDPHYVGLTGLEFFSSAGDPVRIIDISADPADINVLPEYDSDPRVVANLIDGVNRTFDEVHMWLCPFTPGRGHHVYVTFAEPVQLAIMRVWNYNKSRVHSSRGAKLIDVALDGIRIFYGEIARGNDETILFTEDDAILERVWHNDLSLQDLETEPDTAPMTHRPRTRDSDEQRQKRLAELDIVPVPGSSKSSAAASDRPVTSAAAAAAPKMYAVQGQQLTLNLVDTWSDPHYIGLTGLELVDSTGQSVPIRPDQLSAEPRDMRVVPGCEADERTLDKLVNGVNSTTDDVNMWLVPFTKGDDHTITVTLDRPAQLLTLRLWNYNKSPEDSYRGVKVMHIQLDGRYLSPELGLLIRKAPGHNYYNFVQEIALADLIRQPSATAIPVTVGNDDYQQAGSLPCGFVYQLNLLNTHGDLYYIGLTELQLFDETGRPIQLSGEAISCGAGRGGFVAAHPESINCLDGVENDVRTPDKLVDGVLDCPAGGHSWLAPILPGTDNRLYLVFNRPVCVSKIRLWNYAKTPSRGVRDFSVLVDELLIFNGTLPRCDRGASADDYHTVLLGEPELLNQHGQQQHHSSTERSVINNREVLFEHDILLMNDQRVVHDTGKRQQQQQQKKKSFPDPMLRPKTSIVRH